MFPGKHPPGSVTGWQGQHTLIHYTKSIVEVYYNRQRIDQSVWPYALSG